MTTTKTFEKVLYKLVKECSFPLQEKEVFKVLNNKELQTFADMMQLPKSERHNLMTSAIRKVKQEVQ